MPPTTDPGALRIEGAYEQAEPGRFMLRTKVPGGALSAEQATTLCRAAEDLATGVLHLTTRMSVELHGVRRDDLEAAVRRLAAVGLTTRGACGGAVRGLALSTPFGPGYAAAQVLARRLHAHFTSNPHFEGLPKKFKVGVDAGYGGARHLIQDVGLVWVGEPDGVPRYDAWLAGGLGRAPAEAFRWAEALPEPRVLPLVEAAVRVHRTHTPPGKRTKHLVQTLGREGFLELLDRELAGAGDLVLTDGFPKALVREPPGTAWARAGIFAGEIAAPALRRLAGVAAGLGTGWLVLTPDQDLLLPAAGLAGLPALEAALAEAGFRGDTPEEQVVMRVCPGSHECKLGLAPTRDLARTLIGAMGPRARGLTWALSGCSNSCAQPQLADLGVLCTRRETGADGQRRPLFTLLRRHGEGFGEPVLERAPLSDLIAWVGGLG